MEKKNFFNEITELTFKPLRYSLYNQLEDEYFIEKLNKLDNTSYSIEDFCYAVFPLSEKERYLIRMWNKEYMENITDLKEILKGEPRCLIYVNHDGGLVMLIKLKKICLNCETMDV
jgi:hypothetical protein